MSRVPALLNAYDSEIWEGTIPQVADVHVHCQFGWLQVNWKGGSRLSHFCPVRAEQTDKEGDFHLRHTGGLRFNFKNNNVVYVCWDRECIEYVDRRWWKFDECVVCERMPEDIKVANQHSGRTTVAPLITNPRWFGDDK